MRGAERTCSARHGATAARIEDLQRTDRRQHDRQSHPAAEQLDGGVDLGDIAQHARAKCNLVERHAVAAHGRFGLGGPDNIVPGILIEIRPRPADELVKVLVFFAARAEFGCHLLDGRPVIHGVSLPFIRDNSRYRPTVKAACPRGLSSNASPAPQLIKQPASDKDTQR
jgi:hypothetical protein